MLSPRLFHRTGNCSDLERWMFEWIKTAVRKCRHTDRNNEFLWTTNFNLVRFYNMFLGGHFVEERGKLIIVTKSAVYSTPYQPTTDGEREVMKEISLLLHDLSPAVIPAKGYWTSAWLTHRGRSTPAYPDTDNTISVLFRNENVDGDTKYLPLLITELRRECYH